MGFSKTQINPVFGLSEIENIISLFDLQDVFCSKTNLNAKEERERFRVRMILERGRFLGVEKIMRNWEIDVETGKRCGLRSAWVLVWWHWMGSWGGGVAFWILEESWILKNKKSPCGRGFLLR